VKWPLLLCSKSEWRPAIRREHAWAQIAAKSGHEVVFLERPRDIRSLRGDERREWVTGFYGGSTCERVASGLTVRRRATVLPGHLNALGARVNIALLHRFLEQQKTTDMSIVCSWPWDWPAVSKVSARRRVFDMADDWGELMPGRRRRFQRYYEQIAAEADEIIVVSPDLQDRFGGRRPLLVRNGVAEGMIGAAVAEPEPRTMIYVGTLTYRFDAQLMCRVLTELPDWRLDLVGACLYPKLGSAPAPELRQLLSFGERVRWHGPLEREAVIPLLDRTAVAVVPNRPEYSLGQDSMKFYDYAARGRPTVSTRWFDAGAIQVPPHLLIAETAAEFAQAVISAGDQSDAQSRDRRDWAALNKWSSRWPVWSDAVFGNA
jgi:glycosyltransferase involved in cell wall biosynthesis